jgi:hypothetical protein
MQAKKAEDLLLGVKVSTNWWGRRQDQQDVQSLQLAWPGILSGGRRNVHTNIFKVIIKTPISFPFVYSML